MLQFTETTMVLGILALTGFAAIDWFVWGMAATRDFYRPSTLRPLSLGELTNKFLGRMVKTNREVLPASAINHVEDHVMAPANDGGHGFKKVA
jgi:hypothetical protein